MKRAQGFTMIELLVTLSVISIMATVVFVNAIEFRKKARDATRQADLKELQTAIEFYKLKNGKYPVGCSGSTGQWSSAASCGEYIIGLAPDFIKELPVDPSGTTANTGYLYTTNSDRTVFKLIAKNSVEKETVTYAHQMRSCDTDICGQVSPGNNRPAWCTEGNAQFQKSYAVWGGFARVEADTEAIVCKQ